MHNGNLSSLSIYPINLQPDATFPTGPKPTTLLQNEWANIIHSRCSLCPDIGGDKLRAESEGAL